MKVPEPVQLPSGSWRCRVRVGGTLTSITESTYDMCYAKAVAVKAGLLEIKKSPTAMTVGQAIDTYIEDRAGVLSPSTVRDYKQIRTVYLQNLMPIRIDRLTKSTVQREMSDATRSGLSPKTVKNAFMLFKAATKGLLPFDPADIKLPAPRTKEGTALTTDQLVTLFRAVAGTDIEVPVLLAAWLSLRRSEIVGLRWQDIGTDSITVSTAMVFDETRTLVRKTTKTAKSTRTIPCPAYIIDKINALPHDDPERIFTKHPNRYWDRLQTICKHCNLPPIGLHSLRHTNASVMLMVGVGEKYAMERGGWSTNRVMQSVYQHTLDEGRQDAANKVNTYFSAIVNASETPQNNP